MTIPVYSICRKRGGPVSAASHRHRRRRAGDGCVHGDRDEA